MTVKKTDKDQLLDNASHLFRLKGYHNTSISDIAESCNLSKGSVYHYITSKKELGIAVIKRAHRAFQENIFSIATNSDVPARDNLFQMCKETETFFINREGGSLIGNLVHEVTETVPEFVELFQAFYIDWINALTKVLVVKFNEQKAKEIAEDTVSQMQGAIMLMQLFKDRAVLERVAANLIEKFDNQH